MDSRIVLAVSLAIATLSSAPAFPEEPAPVPATPGPAVPGPAVPGPAAPGPAASGPTAPGPAASGPTAPGPAASGPTAPGPAASGPATSGPAASGTTVGEIRIVPENIFDTADPKEDNWVFRLANRLHIRTHPWVIRRQLLFRPGDPYDPRLLAESERILRADGYFYDARVRPGEARDGRVDVEARTRDVWTLQPGFSFKREGGKNTTGLDLREKNLFGLGSSLGIASKSTPDRRENSVTFADDHLFGSRLRTSLLLSTNSDGHKRSVVLERPFYALDARWAVGGLASDEERIDSVVGAGTAAGRHRMREKEINVSGGWSRGLVNRWALRYLVGWTRDATRFSVVAGDNAAAPVPADRVLAYPYAGFELVEDQFETARNRDQIERTEDFYLGLRLRATAGYAFPSIGSDRHAAPFSVSFADGGRPGDRWTLTSEAAADGRIENGAARDTKLSAAARVYCELSERWLSFASLAGSRLVEPDGDHQLKLGGDTGLRGYPTDYQAGDRMFLVTLEQRYFSPWYLFRLVHLGAAAFFDEGRAWGGNVTGLPAPGLLRDAGVGLRFGLTRSGLGNVIHVDVAFPFDGDPSIARAQFHIVTKNSF